MKVVIIQGKHLNHKEVKRIEVNHLWSLLYQWVKRKVFLLKKHYKFKESIVVEKKVKLGKRLEINRLVL